MTGFAFPRLRPKERAITDDTPINEAIPESQVDLIAGDGTRLGTMATTDALALARAQGLDLVEVARDANPPVCRLMDFEAFKAAQDERRRETREREPGVPLAGFLTKGSATAEFAETVMGLDEDDAKARVEGAGYLFRVMSRDGVSLRLRTDLRPNRINVTVEHGKVTATRVG